MIRVERDDVETGEETYQQEPQQDMFRKLMEAKHVVENGPFLSQQQDDDEEDGSLDDNRFRVEYALSKLDKVDKLVKDFTRACNKGDFVFSLINSRDSIVFNNLSRRDQKNFETRLLEIVNKQRREYDGKLVDLEDRVRHFDLNKQIEEFKNREARKNNPLSLNANMGQILDAPLDENSIPTNIQELEELESIVDKGQTPTVLHMLNIQKKLDMKLKTERKKVVKLLKIISNINVVHPTWVSVNTDNMISQQQPYTDPVDSKLATEYHTSEGSKWTNWSNSSFLWKKTLNSLDVSTALEVFVSSEYVDYIDDRKIGALVDTVSEQMTDAYTTLDPADPNTVKILVSRARDQFGEMLTNSDVQTMIRNKEEANNKNFITTVQKTELTVLNKCYSKIQAIVSKNSLFLESQIRLFIKYSFTGQYIPYVARSAYIETEEHHYADDDNDDKDYLFDSILLKKPNFVIPEPDTIMVVKYKRDRTYVGYYLPTNTPLHFVVKKDNGRLSEQLLAVEIKHAGLTARLEDVLKQKPFVIVERKTNKEKDGLKTRGDTSSGGVVVSSVDGGGNAKKQFNVGDNEKKKRGGKRKLIDDSWYTEGYDNNDCTLYDERDLKYAKLDEQELDSQINRLRKKILNHRDDSINNPKIYRPSVKTVTGEGPVVYTLRNKPKPAQGEKGSGSKGKSKGKNQMRLPARPSAGKPIMYQEFDDDWNYRDTKMAETGRPNLDFMIDAEKRDVEMKQRMLMFQEKRWSDYEDMLIKNHQIEEKEKRSFIKKLSAAQSTRKADLSKINETLKKLQSSLTSKAEMEGSQIGLLDTQPLLNIVQNGFGDMDKMYKQMIEHIRKIGINLDEDGENEDGQPRVFVEFNNRIDMALATYSDIIERRLLDMQTMYKHTEDNIRQMLRNVVKPRGLANGGLDSRTLNEKSAIVGCYEDRDFGGGRDGCCDDDDDIDMYQTMVDTRTTEMTDREFEYELNLRMGDMRVIQGDSDNEEGGSSTKRKKGKSHRSKKGSDKTTITKKKKRGGTSRITGTSATNMIDKAAYEELEVSLKNMDMFCSRLVERLGSSIENYNKAIAQQSSCELKLEIQEKKMSTYENLISFFSNQLKTQIEANKMEIKSFENRFTAFISGVTKHLEKRLERTKKQDESLETLRQHLIESPLTRLKDLDIEPDDNESNSAARDLIMSLQQLQQERTYYSRAEFEKSRQELKDSQTMFNVIKSNLTMQYYQDRVQDRTKFMRLYDDALEESRQVRKVNRDDVTLENNRYIDKERAYLDQEREGYRTYKDKVQTINLNNAQQQSSSPDGSQQSGRGDDDNTNTRSPSQNRQQDSSTQQPLSVSIDNQVPSTSTAAVFDDDEGRQQERSGDQLSSRASNSVDNRDEVDRWIQSSETDRFKEGETVQEYLTRVGIGVSELDSEKGPYIDMGDLNTRPIKDLSQAEQNALIKAAKLFVEDTETAKAAKEIHEKNRELKEKQKAALEAELKQKMDERSINRDMHRVMNIKRNYNTMKQCSKEHPMLSEVCKEMTETKSLNPQIIELGDGQIYRMGYFGAPSQRNIEKIQSMCHKSWVTATKQSFKRIRKIHETGAKLPGYEDQKFNLDKYVLPLLEIIYGEKSADNENEVIPKNLRRYRLNDKNVLFTNDSKRFILYLRDSLDNAGVYVKKLCETAVRDIIRKS